MAGTTHRRTLEFGIGIRCYKNRPAPLPIEGGGGGGFTLQCKSLETPQKEIGQVWHGLALFFSDWELPSNPLRLLLRDWVGAVQCVRTAQGRGYGESCGLCRVALRRESFFKWQFGVASPMLTKFRAAPYNRRMPYAEYRAVGWVCPPCPGCAHTLPWVCPHPALGLPTLPCHTCRRTDSAGGTAACDALRPVGKCRRTAAGVRLSATTPFCASHAWISRDPPSPKRLVGGDRLANLTSNCLSLPPPFYSFGAC